MTDNDETQLKRIVGEIGRIRKKNLVRLLLLFLPGGGAGAVWWAVGTSIPRGLLALTTAIVLSLLFLILWFLNKFDVDERIQHEINDIEEKHQAEISQLRLHYGIESKGQEYERKFRQQSVELMRHIIDNSSSSLRFITEELRRISKSLLAIDSVGRKVEWEASKPFILRRVLENIKESFEKDSRGVDETLYPHNYFKTALYEPKHLSDSSEILVRTAYCYPDIVEPTPETEIFNLKEHNRAAVVLAFNSQKAIVIQDVKGERVKTLHNQRWVDMVEGQSDRYESVICVPILSGTRGRPERKCLGVLVVDTNRKKYFLEDDINYEAFLGTLLNPFRTILTFVLEVEIYLAVSPSNWWSYHTLFRRRELPL